METNFVLDDKFWIDALYVKENASEIIRLFYRHDLPLSKITKSFPTIVLTDNQIYDIILRVLIKTPCSEIISILKLEGVIFDIKKADICQYSSFEDCYYRVINLTVRSGIEGIAWDRMGFLLRTSPRSKMADTKYGENHGKTAVQLGLCQMDKYHHFWPTDFGVRFDELDMESKNELKSKLCLYIPIVQNYFHCDMDDNLLATYFDLLTETTQKRRRPNVSALINKVKESLKNEF